MDNVDKLRMKMKDSNLDGFFITNPHNVRYISGFTGGDSFVLVTGEKKYFITDGRYTEQAQNECTDFELVDWRAKELPLWETIKLISKESRIAKLGFEASSMAYGMYSGISENVGFVELVPVWGLIEKQRSMKTEYEIQCIKKAADMAGRAFQKLLDHIKPGVTENYLFRMLTNHLWEEGSEAKLKGPTVLSGARTSLIHGIPSNKKVEYGDFVLMDFGAIYKGYFSDITRTVVVGRATDKQKEIYGIERQALENQINSIKSGISAREPYYASIVPMKSTEYFEYHYDKVGHGLGLHIHEIPFMSPKTNDIIEENNVITIEPGMYIPGWGGVRIEDMVLVKKDGCEVLNKINRDLIIL